MLQCEFDFCSNEADRIRYYSTREYYTICGNHANYSEAVEETIFAGQSTPTVAASPS